MHFELALTVSASLETFPPAGENGMHGSATTARTLTTTEIPPECVVKIEVSEIKSIFFSNI